MNPQDTPPAATPPPLEAPLPENPDLKSLLEALLRRPVAALREAGEHPAVRRLVAAEAVDAADQVREVLQVAAA